MLDTRSCAVVLCSLGVGMVYHRLINTKGVLEEAVMRRYGSCRTKRYIYIYIYIYIYRGIIRGRREARKSNGISTLSPEVLLPLLSSPTPPATRKTSPFAKPTTATRIVARPVESENRLHGSTTKSRLTLFDLLRSRHMCCEYVFVYRIMIL